MTKTILTVFFWDMVYILMLENIDVSYKVHCTYGGCNSAIRFELGYFWISVEILQ